MPIRQPVLRVFAWYAAILLVIALAGAGWETRQLGWSDDQAASRIAAGITAEFTATVRDLGSVASSIAGERDAIRLAPATAPAVRELFARLARHASVDVSATVYAQDHTPLAWVGRPSDLALVRSRLDGPAVFVVVVTPSGSRLMALQPVTGDAAPGNRRLGTVVAERLLPTTAAAGSDDGAIVWPTAAAPVRLTVGAPGRRPAQRTGRFALRGPAGEALLEGSIAPADVAAARSRIRRVAGAALLSATALFSAWLTLPLLYGHPRRLSRVRGTARVILASGALLSARVCLRYAVWLAGVAPSLHATDPLFPALQPYIDTPADLMATAIAALALAAIANHAVGQLRAARTFRVLVTGPRRITAFAVVQVLASIAALGVVAWYDSALQRLAAVPGVDLLSFSWHPWDSDRVALSVAILTLHAAVVWAAVALLRFGLLWFNTGTGAKSRLVWTLAWVLPLTGLALRASSPAGAPPAWAFMLPVALAMAFAWSAMRFARWRRHASHTASIAMMFLALALPSYGLYPAAFIHATRARQAVVETQLAPQAARQREDLQMHVRRALGQIDRMAGLTTLARPRDASAAQVPSTDAAFQIWSGTDLGAYRLTSAVELYSADGELVSRFALNLPEYASAQQKWQEASCDWDLFEEVSPFGSEERRLLHAGRGLCVDGPGGPRSVGAIVIHAMLDYAALPFLTSQSPYVEFFRRARIPGVDTPHGRETEFAVYGWSRRPLFESSSGAWTIDDETFGRIYASRDPFWIRQSRAGRTFDIFLSNDRGGINALGIPTLDWLGHFVLFAELATLAGGLYALWLFIGAIGGALGLTAPDRGHELFREIRASFYRKLALGVVAAAVIPVTFLAVLAQTYMTAQLRAGIDESAARIAAVAQRVVEDYGRLQERADTPGQPLTDDILVWISRVIDQDVSVYEGPTLEATSERDLFASGLLPTRTPANVYEAIALERRATYVDEERAGELPYLVAAAPARVAGHDAILTVPLTLRQQAIEREIDGLNRRILLAVVAFILLGAGFGWWMAERIADPVRALQRATGRMSKGDLDIRLPMSASNELSRLVSAFNQMATDLRKHQADAARANKLEAWADMARQVAHEIKNPLTPIQLSAEHLRRVHADQGSPLGPVMDNCVDSILAQVRLLRQIAGDFSSFASSPTPRLVPIRPAELVEEVLAPYRTGLPGGIRLVVDAPAGLPPVTADRSLLGRALANVVENALHAMPSGGTLSVRARPAASGAALELVVTDTGMEKLALERAFEPYFSTKAIGTGLGLTIVKRNIELHGGTVTVSSEPGAGTVVVLSLPTQP